MFNNSDSSLNGESYFLNKLKPNINVAFDVGCRYDSEFVNIDAEVHYFEPVIDFIDHISKQKNKNKKSYFNNFGLGNESKEIFYYPKYQSFCDRVKSCNVSDDSNKVLLRILKAKDYIIKNKIEHIDFLKIDTEGYELNVLMGFEDMLSRVKIIQFEYGGTFLDNNVKLIDVVNYLQKNGFYKFSYLTLNGTQLINDFRDHYQYCNIVCINKNSDFVPF